MGRVVNGSYRVWVVSTVKVLNVLVYANTNSTHLINVYENSNSNSTHLVYGLPDPTRITHLVK